ncbi:MAG: hypothetical protein FJ100_13595 [Deltaproteobacteria bacterium]|nr:hypothetical protein [Deltaproteobacteria bacterium]
MITPAGRRSWTWLFLGTVAAAGGVASASRAKPPEQLVQSAIAIPPVALPQARIDHLDLSAWPKVRALLTVLDGRGAPVEIKGLVKLDVLDGTRKASSASKNNPAIVAFEKGVALGNRKDAKLMPRPEAKIGLGAVVVAQGYKVTVEPVEQQRIREGLGAIFKGLGKGDRANVVWYDDRLHIATGVRDLNTRLVDIEGADVRKKCADARREARSGGPITLGPPSSKDVPPPPPGTDLCGLQPDPSKVAELVKSDAGAAFNGAFPRLFALGPPFYDLGRYCATPSGALGGFASFAKAEYEPARQQREDAESRGEPVDFVTSAIDVGLGMLVKDGRPGEQLALVVMSDGRDGWVHDLATCAEHPPKPCDLYDASADVNAGRLAALKSDNQRNAERYRLATELKRCVEKNNVLTDRVARWQKAFRDKAKQWIGLARAANIRIFALGLRRPGVTTNPYDLERLRLLAERTGGTYREVPAGVGPAELAKRTMSEVGGQIALEFTHHDPDAVAEAGDTFSIKVAVKLDPKLEHATNTGTDLTTQPVTLPLPKSPSLWKQLKTVGWSVLVRIQELMGYEVYVIFGYVLTVAALLLGLLIVIKIFKKVFARAPKAA